MHKRIAVLLCLLVLVAGVPLALSAQITSVTYTDSLYAYNGGAALGNGYAGAGGSSIDYILLTPFKSPTKNASMSIFSTDYDKVIDVVNYQSLIGGKPFYYLGFSDSTLYLNAGFSHTFGSLFVGATYNGNVLSSSGAPGNTDKINEVLNGDSALASTYNQTTTNGDSTYAGKNRLSVLFGFGNFGINAIVYEDISQTTGRFNSVYTGNQNDTVTPDGTGKTATTTYTPTTSGYSNWAAMLQAGTVIALGDNAIKPYIKLGANFHNADNAANWVQYTQYAGSGLPAYSGAGSLADLSAYNSNKYYAKTDYITPIADAGATFAAGPLTLDLNYQFEMPLYSSGYTDTDGTTAKTVAGLASGSNLVVYTANTATNNTTITTNSYSLTTISEYAHMIDPSVKYSGTLVDKVKAGFKFEPKVFIDSNSKADSGSSVVTTVIADSVTPLTGSTAVATTTTSGASTSYSYIGVTPTLTGAVQFVVVDKVLTFNIGAKVAAENFGSYTNTTTYTGYTSTKTVTTTNNGLTTTTYSSPNLGSNYTDTSTTNWSLANFSNSLSWGITWTIGDGVALDTVFDLATGTSLSIGSFKIALTIKK